MAFPKHLDVILNSAPGLNMADSNVSRCSTLIFWEKKTITKTKQKHLDAILNDALGLNIPEGDVSGSSTLLALRRVQAACDGCFTASVSAE